MRTTACVVLVAQAVFLAEREHKDTDKHELLQTPLITLPTPRTATVGNENARGTETMCFVLMSVIPGVVELFFFYSFRFFATTLPFYGE